MVESLLTVMVRCGLLLETRLLPVSEKMNTVLSRLNTIFAFTLSVMAGLTFLCFLSTAFNEHQSVVAINTGKVIV